MPTNCKYGCRGGQNGGCPDDHAKPCDKCGGPARYGKDGLWYCSPCWQAKAPTAP